MILAEAMIITSLLSTHTNISMKRLIRVPRNIVWIKTTLNPRLKGLIQRVILNLTSFLLTLKHPVDSIMGEVKTKLRKKIDTKGSVRTSRRLAKSKLRLASRIGNGNI